MLCPAWYSLALGPQFSPWNCRCVACMCTVRVCFNPSMWEFKRSEKNTPQLQLFFWPVYHLKINWYVKIDNVGSCGKILTPARSCARLHELMVSYRVNSQVMVCTGRQADKFAHGMTFAGTAGLCWSGSKQPVSWENGGLIAGRAELRITGMIVQSDQLCRGEGLEALTCTQHM